MKIIITAVFLLVCAIQDIKEKSLSVILLLAGAVLASGLLIWPEPAPLKETLLSLLPGTVLLILAFFTKEKVGAGDGLLMVIVGMFTGVSVCLILLLSTLLLISAFSILLLALKKVTLKTKLPFAAFLFAAYIGGILLWDFL